MKHHKVWYILIMKKLVLISGVSGAGKTTASNILEDMGYTCIDQYPVELLSNLIELINEDNSIKYEKVAMTIPLYDLEKFYNMLSNNDNIKTILILLDAKKQVIINRYKFTRRVHPLVTMNVVSTIEEAVEYEKNIIDKLSDKNVRVIDTTNMSLKAHKEILDNILQYDDVNNLAITFESFGFKNGVPDDADMVFDVRMLDNPFYVNNLKKKTGNDKAVQKYVLDNDLSQKYIKKLVTLLNFTLKAYKQGQKRHLTICIGCTGGQHRSVTIANYLYDLYKDKYVCYIKHREIEK